MADFVFKRRHVRFIVEIMQMQEHIAEKAGLLIRRVGKSKAAAEFGPVASHITFVSYRRGR